MGIEIPIYRDKFTQTTLNKACNQIIKDWYAESGDRSAQPNLHK